MPPQQAFNPSVPGIVKGGTIPGTQAPSPRVIGNFGDPNVPHYNPAGATSAFSGDPGYAAAQSAENLGVSSLNSQLQSQIAQRIAAYGDPNLASMAGFGLDPQAAAFARQNYLSGNAELSRIDKAHKNAQQAIINQLAAHGLLTSGETGYQTGNESQAYGNNVYDAQQRALADILGYRQGTQSQITGLHSQTIQALQQAYQNYISNPALYGTGNPGGGVQSPPAVAKTPSAPNLQAAMAAALRKPSTPKKPAPRPNAYTSGQKRSG